MLFSNLCPFSFAITLIGKRALACFTLIAFLIFATVSVLWLFLMVRWVELQYVIRVISDHTHFLFHYLECFTNDILFVIHRIVYHRQRTQLKLINYLIPTDSSLPLAYLQYENALRLRFQCVTIVQVLGLNCVENANQRNVRFMNILKR